MSGRYKRRGWYGDSHGHSLAAKGIRLYSKKTPVHEAFFYAQKAEEQVPTTRLQIMIKNGMTFDEIVSKYDKADPEDLRKRGLKMIENHEGNNTMSTIDRQGVDLTVQMTERSSRFKDNVLKVINDEQMSSFIPEPKLISLKQNMRSIK